MPHDILNHILEVTHARPCGLDRWMGHCIGHGSQRHRDLSIRKTLRLILVHCFGACDFSTICRSLGIVPAQLFLDSPLPRGARPLPKPTRPDHRKTAHPLGVHAQALKERALVALDAASGLDCSSWSSDDWDMAWDAVGRAFDDLTHVENLFATADRLHERAYAEEQPERNTKENR